MNLTDLNHQASRYKSRKRIGRGHGSGWGKTAGRGHKGQRSRSGFKRRYGYEGGQMALFRRFSKRGFTNIFRTAYDLVNLDALNAFEDGTTISHGFLVERGALKSRHGRLKVLARGKLERKLTVEAAKFSQSARGQIEGLGGEAKEI